MDDWSQLKLQDEASFCPLRGTRRLAHTKVMWTYLVPTWPTRPRESHTCQPSPPRNALHTSDQKTPLSSWGNLWGRACLGPCWGKMTEVCPDISSCNQQQLKVFTRKRAGVKYIKSIIKYIMKQLIQDDRGRVSLSRWLVNCQKLPSTRNFLSLPLIQSLWKATSAKNV